MRTPSTPAPAAANSALSWEYIGQPADSLMHMIAIRLATKRIAELHGRTVREAESSAARLTKCWNEHDALVADNARLRTALENIALFAGYRGCDGKEPMRNAVIARMADRALAGKAVQS